MEQLINFLIENGRSWVISQRDSNRGSAEPLSRLEIDQLGVHFQPGTLDRVRVRKVSQIENPGFYSALEQADQSIPLDFRQMAGITFVDTLLVAEPKVPNERWIPLLFHECVHVCQYHVLGVNIFVREYVNGWAQNGFDYNQIPLERDAYELQRAFEASPHRNLNIEEQIIRKLWHIV